MITKLNSYTLLDNSIKDMRNALTILTEVLLKQVVWI